MSIQVNIKKAPSLFILRTSRLQIKKEHNLKDLEKFSSKPQSTCINIYRVGLNDCYRTLFGRHSKRSNTLVFDNFFEYLEEIFLFI